MGMGDYSPGSKWFYAPTKIAPIIFIVLFAISGAVHAYQTMYVFLPRIYQIPTRRLLPTY
jgi:hypothetical protein